MDNSTGATVVIGAFPMSAPQSGSGAAGNAQASQSLGAGAVVGIVLAVLVFLVLVAILLFVLWRRPEVLSEVDDSEAEMDIPQSDSFWMPEATRAPFSCENPLESDEAGKDGFGSLQIDPEERLL
jgi:hypothetical protein